MSLSRVRLELARSKEFPDGSKQHGYEFVAPLTADGHLDDAAWKTAKAKCTVRRFTAGEDAQTGMLVHAHKRWIFDYDKTGSEDDEPLFKLDRHSIKQGEYLSVTEHDGVTRTFKIVSVTPQR